MSVAVGLDLGSTSIKTIFVKGDRAIWRGVAPTAPGQENVARSLINDGLSACGLTRGDISAVASTGYGKKLFPSADRYIDEISANAAGAFKMSGRQARTIVNIGGQDLKVLFLGSDGRVEDFRMNDKCAAGTGRFFELVARLLDTPLSGFDRLYEAASGDVEINSTCVVFAESEIVSLMARGIKKEDIAGALYASVARRIAGLLGSSSEGGAIYIDGGPAQNRALANALEDELMTEVRVLEAPQYTVAYGATMMLEGGD
ncbi:MAG: acyl-CoA dehydratase activase [Synergistaceae bacterium]|jgi:predicted CoA-substrate-specific enzyme activase|nr:acyl-CoA dehydratase activase [Synergistaceae bacterium]